MFRAKFIGNAGTRGSRDADTADNRRLEHQLHPLQHPLCGLGLLEPNRRQQVELLGSFHVRNRHLADFRENIGLHGRRPLLQMLGVGELLLALSQRDLEHVAERRRGQRLLLLLGAQIDATSSRFPKRGGGLTGVVERDVRIRA